MHAAQPTVRRLALLLFDPRGRVDRLPFIYAAVALCAVKVCLDYFVAEYALRADWNWQNYLLSTLARPTSGGVVGPHAHLAVMLALAVPFAWSGVALTAKRLRSASAPVWLVI